jgi:TIR domain-containing protein
VVVSEIFISHVEEDEGVALEIARGLEAAGYRTWYYERDADPGPSYLLQVNRAIESCRAIVIVISPAAVRSNQMTVEVVRGHESGKPFLPVRSGISHADFQARQPEWRVALGASASLAIPPEGPGAIVPRLVRGLQGLAVEAGKVPTEDETTRARRESERHQRDSEFANLERRLDQQLDRSAFADALGTAEAMLRVRPGDTKTLATRAFISERLARAASRRGLLELVRKAFQSKTRVAVAAGVVAIVAAAIASIANRPSEDRRAPEPPPVAIASREPESTRAATPSREVERTVPPANVVAEPTKPDAPASRPPAAAKERGPHRVAYSGFDVIGRRPAVVQVFDPT